jgi:TPR repeat protein
MYRFVLILCILSLGLVTPAMAVDTGRKLALLESAVAGDANAQYELAMIYEEEAYEQSEDPFEPEPELWGKVRHWCEAAADQGHSEAKLALLQRVYDPSLGEEESRKWYKLAHEMAERGDKVAQYQLAEIYFAKCLGEVLEAGDSPARSDSAEPALRWYSRLLDGLKSHQTVILSKLETHDREVTVDNVNEKLAYLRKLAQ